VIQEIKRNERQIATVAREFDPRTFDVESALILARVTSSTAISGSFGRFIYQCAEAWTGPSPIHTPATRADGRTFTPCLSVSELSNLAPPSFLSYGVNTNNLVGTFGPAPIPNNTAVVLSPHRGSDGILVWLIINTQAIDGTCDTT
jgi:hypothetical protein